MLIAAAVLTVVIVIAHSVLGERYILTRLFRRDLPKLFGSDVFTKQTLRLAWHITSAMGLGFAILLIAMASPGAIDERTIATILASTFALSGIIALVISRGAHLSWIVFFAVAALAWLAR
jgi:hypothetical protein